MNTTRLFAVLPAAGLSRRMGKPKLLLPFRGKTVVRNLVETLQSTGVAPTFVVCRQNDDELRAELATLDVHTICPPLDPPDMRASVEVALAEARRLLGPEVLQHSYWLLIPSDHPLLHASTVDFIKQYIDVACDTILIPTYDGQRGHPTAIPGWLAGEFSRIPDNRGLNWLIRQHAEKIREIPVSHPGVLFDLDTPEDYQKLLESYDEKSAGLSNEQAPPPTT